MTIETPFRNIIDLQDALTDLSHDIDDICVHGRPYHFSSLANAPTLENWSFAALFSPCLIGEVTGHPLLGDRPSIHTSQLMVLDAERGWARTWSRFYRLGAPHRRYQGH
jgi:hypothetical protein